MGEVVELPLAYLKAIEEANEAAGGITRLLVDLGHKPEPITGWWAFQGFEQLGGRTPARAWLDGMRDEVRQLIVSLYDRTSKGQESALQDNDFVDGLRARLVELEPSRPGSAESA